MKRVHYILFCISLSFFDEIKLPNVEVGESHTGGSEVTISTATGHAIEPTHVNSAATPERSNKDHVIESGSKSANVSAIVTGIETSGTSILFKPDIDGSGILEMGDNERSVGVDCATVLGAHQVAIGVKGIGLTAAAIAVVPPSTATIASVQSDSHSVLVTFPSVVFRAVQTVTGEGIAVVFSIIAGIVPHLREVGGRVAVTTDSANINGVRKVFAIQGHLPPHVAAEVISGLVGKVDATAAVQTELIAVDLDVSGHPVTSYNVHLTGTIDIDAAHVFGKGGSNKCSQQE